MKTPNDVRIENHGSLFMFTPLTDIACEWVNENVGLMSWQWCGPSFAVEPRRALALAVGMADDGLQIESDS